MSKAAQEARRKYAREWAAKNRDKQKRAKERYWERKALKDQAQGTNSDTKSRKD